MAVLVVEAASRSGSLITARMALEQGRDVMAVPGPRTSPLSKGCHRLIRQGAALVEEPEDVLEALNLPALVQTSAGKLRPGEEPQQLKPSEHQVLAAVGYQYTSLITIATNSRIDSQYLTSSLLSLELKGLISSYGDGYIRHRPT